MDDPREVRRAIRRGEHSGHTAGLAPGYVQGNVCILPREYAEEFALFCERNPKPCPLLAASRPGEAQLPSLGKDLDIRTDVPRYRVFRDGERVAEVGDIRALWREDLVAFVLGCSFSFEQALLEAGLRLRYVEEGKNVPMYRTSIDTAPAGRFRGKLVVSMRPFKPADAIRAIVITSRYPRVHGAPVHLGRPDHDCAARFRGKLVVSMRPFKPADAIRAIVITSRYPRVHGAPVHLGRPDHDCADRV